MSEVEKGYIGPLEWFSVPGGRVYCIGHEKAMAMCFAPDDEDAEAKLQRVSTIAAEAIAVSEELEKERNEALAALAKIAATDMSVPKAEWPQHYFQRRLYEAKEIAGWEPKGGEDD